MPIKERLRGINRMEGLNTVINHLGGQDVVKGKIIALYVVKHSEINSGIAPVYHQ